MFSSSQEESEVAGEEGDAEAELTVVIRASIEPVAAAAAAATAAATATTPSQQQKQTHQVIISFLVS